MATRQQLEEYERYLWNEVAERRQRGGYSPDAPALQRICEILYEMVRDRRERMPQPKPKKEEE